MIESGIGSLKYGMLGPDGSGASVSVNSASTYCAYSFYATEALVAGLYLSLGALNGTIANIKITVELRADDASTGRPSATVLETTETTGGWTASKLNAFAVSWATTLTIGTRYWLVVKNTSAAPTTDYFAINHSMRGISEEYGYSTTLATGICKMASTDSGSTWANGATNATAIAVKFPSGKLNVRSMDAASSSDSNTKVYETRKSGVTFVSPNFFCNLQSVTLNVRSSGTVTWGVDFYVYINGSLVRTITPNISSPTTLFASSGSAYVLGFFDPVITIPPDSVVTIVYGAVGGAGTSSNFLYNNSLYTLNNDSVLKAAKPCNGTLSKIYYDGSSWTVTDTQYYQIGLNCNPVSPVAESPINRRQFNSMR